MIKKKKIKLSERVEMLEEKCMFLEDKVMSTYEKESRLLEILNSILGYSPIFSDPCYKPYKSVPEALDEVLRKFKNDITKLEKTFNQIETKQKNQELINSIECAFDFSRFVNDLFMPQKKQKKTSEKAKKTTKKGAK
jgi:hypothetical protein